MQCSANFHVVTPISNKLVDFLLLHPYQMNWPISILLHPFSDKLANFHAITLISEKLADFLLLHPYQMNWLISSCYTRFRQIG